MQAILYLRHTNIKADIKESLMRNCNISITKKYRNLIK